MSKIKCTCEVMVLSIWGNSNPITPLKRLIPKFCCVAEINEKNSSKTKINEKKFNDITTFQINFEVVY